MSTTKITKGGSGGRGGGSGGAPTHLRTPVAASNTGADDVRVLVLREVLDLLRLQGVDGGEEAAHAIPHAVVAGEPRWLHGQVITWIALGGEARRHVTRNTRAARREF
jgi:hypothetical protein